MTCRALCFFGNDGEAQPFAIEDDLGEAQPRGKEKIVWH